MNLSENPNNFKNRIINTFSKNNLSTIAILIVFSSFLGVLYNALLPERLPFVYQPKKIEKVNDSLLFKSHTLAPTGSRMPKTESIIKETKPNSSDSTNANKKKVDSAKIAQNKTTAELQPSNSNEVRTLTYSQLTKILNNKDFIIIDARRPDDYTKGHIPSAINIFALADAQEKFEQIMKLNPDKTIVVYCDGINCDLSHELANELKSAFAFQHVFLYVGGWEEWQQKRG